jgi:hypothetical protein
MFLTLLKRKLGPLVFKEVLFSGFKRRVNFPVCHCNLPGQWPGPWRADTLDLKRPPLSIAHPLIGAMITLFKPPGINRDFRGPTKGGVLKGITASLN